MRIMAIDPGISGGLAIMVDGQPLTQHVMPLATAAAVGFVSQKSAKKKVVNLSQIKTIVVTYRIELVLIEGQWRDGMCNQCKLEALMQIEGIPYQIIHPRSWQTIIPPDIKQSFKDTKQRAIETCHRLCLPVQANGSDRGYHDGLADAWCIAAYYTKSQTDNGGKSKKNGKRKSK